jgi:cellulose biosynthesis protein BcsQ
MKSLAFFNNKGGVGKTTMLVHLAWSFADLGLKVVVADLDPQANATAALLDDNRLEELWPDGDRSRTIFGCVQPLVERTGDVSSPHVEAVDNRLGLIVGDLALAGFEDLLGQEWGGLFRPDEGAFRVTSAFWRVIRDAARQREADIVLIDVGPNLGAINRAALLAADNVAVPIAPDLYSLQGLKNLGRALTKWRGEWENALQRRKATADLSLPSGAMAPIGYIVLQHAVRLDRPVKAYEKWIARIPGEYRRSVLGLDESSAGQLFADIRADPNCVAMIKHYRSLMPLALEARKPMFHLTAADGALGAHAKAAISAGQDFASLARKLAERIGVRIAGPSLQSVAS